MSRSTVNQTLVNGWAIDSLKIRIPLNRVQILDEGIREVVANVSTRTGEVLQEKENTRSSRDEHGIKTEFSIEKRATQFETVQYLIILVNAKQLKERYFEGIKGKTLLSFTRISSGLGWFNSASRSSFGVNARILTFERTSLQRRTR